MIDQEVLLLKDLMNHVDSSKREALLNLQKELSLRPDLKIKSYVEGFSFDAFLGQFFRFSALESQLSEALYSDQNSNWLKRVKEDNLVYFLVDDDTWKTKKPIENVWISLTLIGPKNDPVLKINVK